MSQNLTDAFRNIFNGYAKAGQVAEVTGAIARYARDQTEMYDIPSCDRDSYDAIQKLNANFRDFKEAYTQKLSKECSKATKNLKFYHEVLEILTQASLIPFFDKKTSVPFASDNCNLMSLSVDLEEETICHKFRQDERCEQYCHPIDVNPFTVGDVASSDNAGDL